MDISVIIPTYNAQSYLPHLLQRLAEQSCDFELIIIDSDSSDETRSIANTYTPHLITIPKESFDHGGTRSQAAKLAKGDIILFLTQDALPTDRYTIERLVDAFEDPKVGAAYGRQIPYDETTLFGKHLRLFNYPEESYIRSIDDAAIYGIKTPFLSDSFAAYRRDILEQIGWFREHLILGEDSYAGAKILMEGYRLAYVADAVVFHSHSYTPLQEFQRYFDIGVFHTMEDWILERFGKAEGEGGRYLKSELAYLISHNAYMKIPEFLLRNGLKYLGYKLGRHFHKIPPRYRTKLSMHKDWWERRDSS